MKVKITLKGVSMVNTGQRKESGADQEPRHAGRDKTKAYLVGGGIASLASAA